MLDPVRDIRSTLHVFLQMSIVEAETEQLIPSDGSALGMRLPYYNSPTFLRLCIEFPRLMSASIVQRKNRERREGKLPSLQVTVGLKLKGGVIYWTKNTT